MQSGLLEMRLILVFEFHIETIERFPLRSRPAEVEPDNPTWRLLGNAELLEASVEGVGLLARIQALERVQILYPLKETLNLELEVTAFGQYLVEFSLHTRRRFPCHLLRKPPDLHALP